MVRDTTKDHRQWATRSAITHECNPAEDGCGCGRYGEPRQTGAYRKHEETSGRDEWGDLQDDDEEQEEREVGASINDQLNDLCRRLNLIRIDADASRAALRQWLGLRSDEDEDEEDLGDPGDPSVLRVLKMRVRDLGTMLEEIRAMIGDA